MNLRSNIVLGALAQRISHVMELAEATMLENRDYLRQNLEDPDAANQSLVFLVDDNPNVVSASLAYVPDYFPSKGRWFEPYVIKKKGGGYIVDHTGGPDHDYFQHPAVQRTMETLEPGWSDAYTYEADTLLRLTTFSYPMFDKQDRLAAVCGLDVDVTWLADVVNDNQRFSSSYTFILTSEGNMVAGPSESRVAPEDVAQMVRLLKDGQTLSLDGKRAVRSVIMTRAPYWQVAQVYQLNEVRAPIRKMRIQQVLLLLLALGILSFIIGRFSKNEKKLQEATASQAQIGSELAVARNIQLEMLPKTFTQDACGTLEPVREVGGDLYDFYRRNGKLFFCIGDVSGKGVPSAMLMSVIHTLFRIVSKREESPSRILGAINRHICEGNDSNMFVTFFIGCLDQYSGHLCYANAGHDKPFFISGKPSLLQVKANLPLGAFPDTEFEEENLDFSAGDSLFLYTDGLTEARNQKNEAFGRPGVEKALLSCAGETPEKIITEMGRVFHEFAGDAPRKDDLTMLAIRFSPHDLLRKELTLTNDSDEVSRLGEFVKGFLADLNLDRKTASGMRLALEEAVVNVMSYAYPAGEKGDITVMADSDHKEVRFIVEDSGTPFDPTAVLAADTSLDAGDRPIGGLGIHLTRKLMDSVSYSRKKGKNVLTLTKKIV